MDEHLFRREALEHRSTPAFGSVFLIQPPSFIVLTMIACAAVTALVVFLCVGQFARKETAQGYLVPDKGLVKIMPPFAGTVIERRVDEGDVVKAGDLLFLVSDNRGTRTTPDIARALLTEAQKQRDAFRKQFEQARRAGELEMEMLEQEVAGLKEELNQADQELMTQKKRLELSRESLQVYRNLASHGHLPRQQLLDYEREHLELAALIDGIERNRASLLRQHETTRAKISIAAIETASRLADYEGRIAEIDQRIAELDSRAGFAIRAPVAGIVTNIRLEPGETVSGDLPLLALLPEDSQLEAVIYIPTRAAGFIKPGAEVRLRYDAFPYQRFGLQHGTIQRISRSVLTPGEMKSPLLVTEPVYRAVVTLQQGHVLAYGNKIPLKPGMLLQADIMLDRQSLWRWLLDPLYATTGRL